MSDLTVANTIIEQMGGAGKLMAMIGAKYFVGDETSVQFSFKGCRKANKCRVTLLPNDLYRMEILKVNKRTYDLEYLYKEEGLYWDMLKPEFEKETGLYLSL